MKNTISGCFDGFTLIELLVVVLIIGILASVALPQYEKAVMKSRYSTLMATTDAIAEAEEVYYMANGTYTEDFEALPVEPTGCTLSSDKTTCTYPWGKCTLDIDIDGTAVCANTQTLNNGYARFFEHSNYSSWGPRACYSFSSDTQSKYTKLCAQMGGTKVSDYSGTNCLPSHGNCHVYRL